MEAIKHFNKLSKSRRRKSNNAFCAGAVPTPPPPLISFLLNGGGGGEVGLGWGGWGALCSPPSSFLSVLLLLLICLHFLLSINWVSLMNIRISLSHIVFKKELCTPQHTHIHTHTTHPRPSHLQSPNGSQGGWVGGGWGGWHISRRWNVFQWN